MNRSIALVLLLAWSPWVGAWDGYDYDSGGYVEIEKGNLVRRGQEIEFYDYEAGEYRAGEVESIRSNGRGAEVEVYDNESGEVRTFDME